MATLQIKKKSLNTWEHIDSELGTFILSKFYFSADGTKFQVVEQGQAKRRIYDITEISVFDIGGSAETFATITALSLRLEELNYPAYNLGGVFSFDPSNYDLSEFTNTSLDPFAQDSDLLLKENTANKTTSIAGNETSNILFATVKAVVDWVTLFFVPASRTLTINGNTQDLSINRTFTDVPQITITTSVSITTATTDSNGLVQNGRHVVIANAANAINLTCNGGVTASYGKAGTAPITFVQGSGRTLVQLNGTALLSGIVGSEAKIWSNGTIDYLTIVNY